MQETVNSAPRNITPEAIEETQETKQFVSNSTFNVKNYLDVKLKDDETEKKLYIRLLTVDKDTNSPFKHIHMHNVGVPKEISPNQFKSYVCLYKTRGNYTETLGTKCPFCEERQHAYNKFVECKKNGELELAEEWKQKSLKLIPNEVSIIRCIERGKEDEGVKFWKFNLRSDELDAEHQIRKLYNDKKEECEMEGRPIENILDIDNGYDLKVTIKRVFDKEGRPTKKTTISISIFGSSKPLAANPELREKWLNDPKTWSDVFVAKPYDYLSVILNGDIPWYDRETKTWTKKMDKEEYIRQKNEEKEKVEMESNADIAEAEKKAMDLEYHEPTKTTAPNPTFIDDDLLPF
jgi:hypothetical protein